MAYKRQEFFDEILDESGEVIQEGTVLRAENLRRMEDGILAAVSTEEQELTEEQQTQARKNIGAVDAEELEDAINSAFGKANLEDYELLGQTPQYLSDPEAVYNVIIAAEGETIVSITSDTVAEMADGTDVAYRNCEETKDGAVYTLACTADGQWFACRKTFKLDGLTPGDTYDLMLDMVGLLQPNLPEDTRGPCGYIAILDASGNNIVAELTYNLDNIQMWSFVARDSTVTVNLYPTHSGIVTAPGAMIRYRDIWINKAGSKSERTKIYKKEFFTAEQIGLSNIPGGVTIEATLGVNVYAQTVESDKPVGLLAGKTCVCFGDSITGNYAAPFDYPTIISNITGVTAINGGFGGCRMAQHPSSAYDAFSMHSLADSVASGDWSVQDAAVGSVESSHAAEHLEALKAVDWATVDFATIFYGTNDFTGGVQIDNAENPMSTATYKGALRHTIETILTAYPKLRLVVITPMFRFWREGDVVTDSDAYTILDLRLPDFVEAAIEVAEEYKIPVIDLYNTLGVNKINCATFLVDGVHPNDNGLERLGESISARLISV